MKNCIKCGEPKPLTPEFFKPRENSKDGFRNVCLICMNKQINERRKKDGGKKRKEYSDKWTGKNKEKLAKYMKEYEKDNKIHLLEYRANYRKERRQMKSFSYSVFRCN